MSTEPKGPSLEALRGEIDAVDRDILTLLARRMAIVTKLAGVKRDQGVRVRDPKRERDIIGDRRTRAEALGLSAELIESIFRLIMWASRDYQASLKAEVPMDMQPKTVAIVGGHGAIGRRMAQLFTDLGHTVLVSDVDTALTPEQAARSADVTLIAVPITVTERVIEQVGPHVPEHGLLMDVTSVKSMPLASMLAHTKASVLGTHPMFGPSVHSLQGQRVVLCRGRGDAWADWVRDVFRARGLITTEASAEEHDRAMAVVQVLTHYQTQVFGLTLARFGAPLGEGLKFTSPAYLMELYVAGRHFGQDPALYGPIEMMNPLTARVTHAFRDAALAIESALVGRDQAAFAGVFEEVRSFFGEFIAEATEQSKFMIDRLVERS